MTPLLPIIIDIAVLAIGLIVILFEAFEEDRRKPLLGWISTTLIGAALVALCFAKPADLSGVSQLAQFYTADSMALFFKKIALASTLVVLIMALEYRPILQKFIPAASPNAGLGEFLALPIFTCVGLMWMASAIDLIMIFVALELVTISFYILVSFTRRNVASLEAGVKYLILGALSTGFLVYGITWVYGITGQTNLNEVAQAIRTLPETSHQALYFAMGLLMIALGFKIAAAPFQLWVPDVYQGAPTPTTAFLSVASKAAGFIVLMRVIQPFFASPVVGEKLLWLLWGLAILTMIYGNLAAMPQDNFKRLLAYSSIGHAGYLLVALASWGPDVPVTVAFYLAAYFIMTMLAFLVMTVVQRATGGDDLANFNGLSQRNPLLAFGLLTAMASLAGVPFTAGFLGKLFVFRDAVAANQWTLIVVGIVTVAAGFYYYLKVVRAMYWNLPSDTAPITVSTLTKVTVVVLTIATFVVGVYPAPILAMLK